jgi:hypothetical protein
MGIFMNIKTIANLVSQSISTIHNYVYPGLTSYMLTAPSTKGCLRLFYADREISDSITPHSHRYSLGCTVLQGEVKNAIYYAMQDDSGDTFMSSRLDYDKLTNDYSKKPIRAERLTSVVTSHLAGDQPEYWLAADTIHSIAFSKDTYVLVSEGPQVNAASIIIEPMVNDIHINTFKREPWMFSSQ